MAGDNMRNIFILDKFIFPKIVNILYILAVIFSMLLGIYIIYDDGIIGGYIDIILFDSSFFIFVMLLVIRVYAEVLVVLFKIYKKMQLISELKAKKLQRENVGE